MLLMSSESGRPILPARISKRRSGTRVARVEDAAFSFDHLAGEADGLAELDAGEIGFGAEVGVADDIEVSEAGDAEGFREAAATGGLEVEEEISLGARIAAQLHAEI